MKNFTLILLVAMIPFLTSAQKRGRKNKNIKTESNVEFMVIKGVEIIFDIDGNNSSKLIDKGDFLKSKIDQLYNSRIQIFYDYGKISSKENSELRNLAEDQKSMADAVNAVAARGWRFQGANIIAEENIRTHYYYMTREK